MLFEKADIPFPKKMYFTQLVASPTIDYRRIIFMYITIPNM